MKSFKILAVVFGLAAASASYAGAIHYNAAVDGVTAPLSVTSFTTTGGSLIADTKNGLTFLGVKSGAAGTEIDFGQSLSVNFAGPVKLASLTLGLLFNGPEYNDQNEIAAAWITGGDIYQLRISGENTAGYYKNNSFLYNISGGATVAGGAGLFTIENPFGGSYLSQLNLYPTKTGSDFGLVAFSTVPDASSTLALMGFGLVGMAGFARRFRNRAK